MLILSRRAGFASRAIFAASHILRAEMSARTRRRRVYTPELAGAVKFNTTASALL